MRQAVKRAAALVLAIAGLAGRGGACSVFYPEIEVGPNFRVKVEGQGRAVEGLVVNAARKDGTSIRAITGRAGVAAFGDLKPGAYFLSAAHDAGLLDGANLEVKKDGPSNVTVPLRWPSIPAVRVRFLRGRLRMGDSLPGRSQTPLSIDLKRGMTGRILKSGQSDGNGAFDFGNATPGIYFLNLKGLGPIAIDVDPDAPTDQLDLELSYSSCGLSYKDRSQCPQGDLRLSRLRGHVVDPTGAAIPDAGVLLFDEAGMLVESVTSGRGGDFSFSHSPGDAYQLVVRRQGFTTTRATLHGQSADTQSQADQLRVELGVGGSCSSARIE